MFRSNWRLRLRAALPHLPLVLFAVALLLTAFAYGVAVGKYQLFPYRHLADGVKTARVTLGLYPEEIYGPDFYRLSSFATLPPAAAAAQRIEFHAGPQLSDPLLWPGGMHQFREHCPDYGCLAVAYNRAGAVARAWPYRPDALEQASAASPAAGFPYERALNFSFARRVFPQVSALYPNGDLLVVFHHQPRSAFPYGAGVARINPAGYPVWFRRDYSHHWADLLENEVALVPSLRIGNETTYYRPGINIGKPLCDTGKPLVDVVHYIDGSGQLLKSIDVARALLESPYAVLLGQTSDPCDPIHLNFVQAIADDYVGADDIAPGDLVVSLRNISAFAILDGIDGSVKRVVRGTFAEQHSVQHWRGSTFIMFDNQNLPSDVPVQSRLLLVDLSNGKETTIFPKGDFPQLPPLFSSYAGNVSVSADRKRAVVAFTAIGIGVEVRLDDGTILNIFRNWHDLSGVPDFPDERNTKAGIFDLYALNYIRLPAGDTAP